MCVCVTCSSQYFYLLDSEEGYVLGWTVSCGDSEGRFCARTWPQILAASFMSCKPFSKTIFFSGPCFFICKVGIIMVPTGKVVALCE